MATTTGMKKKQTIIGQSKTCHITSADWTAPTRMQNTMLPPITTARRHRPRRTVMAASTTNTTNNRKLDEPTTIQGFGTPLATVTDSPRKEMCRRAVISRKLRFGVKTKSRKGPRCPHATNRPRKPRSPGPQVEPHEADERHNNDPD